MHLENRRILILTVSMEANSDHCMGGNPTRSWVCMHNQVIFSSNLIDLTHQLSPNLIEEASKGFSCTYSDYTVNYYLLSKCDLQLHSAIQEVPLYQCNMHVNAI